MVLFKGTQRLLDAPIIENSSDAATREIEIYGITDYNELLHKTVHVLSNAHGTSAKCTMNVNSLGAKSLKTYKNGIKVDLFDGWIAINQVYAITYDGTDFLVSHINPEEQDTSTVEIYHTNSMILDLNNESTSEEITQAFEGEENIIAFQEALATQKHIIIDISNSMGTGDYNCSYQFTGLLTPDSTETIDLISYIDTDNDKLITMTFTRGADNTYSSVKKEEVNIGGTNSFVVPSDVTFLYEESTTADIIEAFGGEENTKAFRAAMENKLPIVVESEYGGYLPVVSQDANYTTTYISFTVVSFNGRACQSSSYMFTKDDTTGMFADGVVVKHVEYVSTEKLTESENTTKTYIDNSINSIIEDMPAQIRAWSVGDGTSYPPATPDETTLTAYMTTEVKNQLGKYVDNGTILRSASILSGADRKSLYTYLYVVNLSYSSMYDGDYEYTFNNITGGVDFYIYWDSSESKWFWNQKGLIQGEPCFIEGTKVLTPSGLTNIEEIEAGDEVISYNFETQQNETKTVTETYTHPESIIYIIEANGERIQSTGDHPFYVIDKLAVEAKNLSATDKLRNKDGEEVDISSVSFEITDVVNVYEIAVEDTHTYYVGDSSILVYNEPAVIK